MGEFANHKIFVKLVVLKPENFFLKFKAAIKIRI